MENITLIIHIHGYICEDKVIAREISWVHKNLDIGETISVFTPDYDLNTKELEKIDYNVKNIHGLKLKRYSNEKGLWISNHDVKNYIKQLHSLYGGTFAFKRGILKQEFFDELGIPSIYLNNIPKCVRILGFGSSMYICQYYKNRLNNKLI